MGILRKKLGHFIKRNLGQFLAAVSVVMIGIMIYIAMNTTYYSLNQTQSTFYRENNFADYYFQMVKAPEEVVKRISALAGVNRVTGRIQMDLPIFKKNEERATARVVSYTLPMDHELNRITVEQGRLFSANQSAGNIEAVVDPHFAPANNLNWGDQLSVIVDGKQRYVTVVGTATSPEFVYPMKDAADILPDPLKFGIFMMEQRQAQQLVNMPGQINQVLIEFTPGTDQEQVVESVKEILKPYGLLGSYPRKNQLSHAVLQAKLDGIRSIALVLPVMFLLLAAVIQFIILRRMVKSQRTQIGVMKAVGYNNTQILLHYTVYALAVSTLGAILGILLGLLMAGGISNLYAKYFNLPNVLNTFNFSTIVYALILSLGIGAVAGLAGSRGVLRIQPAEAMRPESPQSNGKSLLERWHFLWRNLSPGWKMTFRNIGRNRGRFAAALIGVIFAVGLLIIAFFYNDAVDYIMQKSFYQGEKYDLIVRFKTIIPEKELINLRHIDGVRNVEAMMEIPVKIHFRNQEEDEVLLAYSVDMSMKTLQDETGQVINIPAEGIIINQRTAQKLGIRVGDQVEVETLLPVGPIHRDTVEIAGETQQLFGGGSYINLEQANRILQESRLVSGAMLQVDPGKANEVESSLNQMLGISSVLSRQKEIQIFQEDMSVVTSVVGLMAFFAVMLGFAIIYNASVINFAERRRELASLRVIGFSIQEISSLLFKENMILLGAGILLGLPFGRFMVQSYVQSASTDQFTLPVVIYPATYLYAAIGGILFVLAAHYLAVRGIKRLDMVATLKNTD